MRKLILIASMAVVALGPAVMAQNAAAQGNPNNAPARSQGVPVSSPEPITLIALAGGAAAAGGLAHRRRKNR